MNLPPFLRPTLAPLLALLVPLAGCSKPPDARAPEEAAATDHGGRVEASTPLERELLGKVEGLPVGTSSVGGEKVSAEGAYDSASGQRCRRVSWSKGARLACRDADGWYFVPDVFGAAGGS